MKIAYMPDTHFGIYDQATPTPEETADAAEHLMVECELAEQVGFDGLWFPERHSRTETFISSTTTLLAAAAARTKNVDLASTVIMPTFHHPVHLAEELANIDVISGGRLIFGAGVGYHEDYFRLFGVPFVKKGRRFEEVMKVMEGVWTQDKFSFEGEFFQFDNVCLTPKSFQRPRPPVWIGAFTEGRPIDRSLDYEGLISWAIALPHSLEQVKIKVEDLRERASKLGKEDWTFAMGLEGWIGDDEEWIRENHGHRWVRELGFYEDESLSGSTERKALEEMERFHVTLGSKQKWIDRLSELREVVAPDYIGIRTRGPNNAPHYYPSKQECLECIESLGEVVKELSK